MKWKKLKNCNFYYAVEDSFYGERKISISKILFEEDSWEIRFDDLIVGQVVNNDINMIKKLVCKEYNLWSKRRNESGLKKISCEHDQIDLMLYYGECALSKIRYIITQSYLTSSIDNHLKEEIDLYKLKYLEGKFAEFRECVTKVYNKWGLEENNAKRAEILYNTLVFKG